MINDFNESSGTLNSSRDTDGGFPWDEVPRPPSIEIGTVGWDDSDKYFEVGTGENDGYTLVRVQLFRGRDGLKPLTPTLGQGTKLLCHIASGVYRIPPKGTRVYVAIPAGMERSPGAGVIFATVEKNPLLQYNDDRAQLNFGENTHVVIRAKSITLTDPGNRFIMIGTSRAGGDPAIVIQDEAGGGGCISGGAVAWFSGGGKSIMQMDDSKLELFQNGGSFTSGVQLTGGNFMGVGSSAWITGGAVYLGRAPLATTPVLVGLTGVGGAPSASVFGSLV